MQAVVLLVISRPVVDVLVAPPAEVAAAVRVLVESLVVVGRGEYVRSKKQASKLASVTERVSKKYIVSE